MPLPGGVLPHGSPPLFSSIEVEAIWKECTDMMGDVEDARREDEEEWLAAAAPENVRDMA